MTGKIIENREVKKIEKEPKVEVSKYNKITIFNKYRLGVRNTFNILSKFLLLFAVFFFITSAIFLEYASFQMSEEENKLEGYNYVFKDLSENRILINKQDRKSFSQDDYKKIATLGNVDYIVEDDLFIDTFFSLQTSGTSWENMIYVSGNFQDIKNFNGDLDEGRMPENDNEIIAIASKKHYNITDNLDELLSTKLKVEGMNNKEVQIVGIKYNENNTDYNYHLYASSKQMADLRNIVNQKNSIVKVLFDNQYIEYPVLPSKNVEKGMAVVDDNLKYQLTNGNIKNKDINISTSNIYYNEELNLKISGTYNKNNIKKMTGYDDYMQSGYRIFINEEDYNSLYDKPSYQSSVYIKDIEEIDSTVKELEDLGLNTKKVADCKVNSDELFVQVIKIFKVIITIILVFVLFFISYFIIRIILKSRNIYYTTLRMLGATFNSVKRILDIELFVNSSLAYLVSLVLIYLVKLNIINFEYIAKLIEYVGFREYALMYIILVCMSQLISRRFSKKLFKKTAINTYNEEV